MPDYNLALKRMNGNAGLLGTLRFLYFSRKIRSLRVMLLGIKHAFQKRGAEGLLILETFLRAMARGYRSGECSWILEDNLLMQPRSRRWAESSTRRTAFIECLFESPAASSRILKQA